MKIQNLLVSVLSLAFFSGCDSATQSVEVNCPDILRLSIAVSVVDSATGSMIGNGVTATAIDGKYFDAVTTPDSPIFASQPVSLVEARAGKYDVYVSKAAYRPWVTRGVVVNKAACGTEQVKLTAKLQK